jgi:hypothetical protein
MFTDPQWDCWCDAFELSKSRFKPQDLINDPNLIGKFIYVAYSAGCHELGISPLGETNEQRS